MQQQSSARQRGKGGRFVSKTTPPQKIADSRALDIPKPDKLFYTSENLTDAKKSETHDLIIFVLDRIKHLTREKTRLRGASPDSKAHVEEMMIGGRLMELEHMLDWLRVRHPLTGDIVAGEVLDRN